MISIRSTFLLDPSSKSSVKMDAASESLAPRGRQWLVDTGLEPRILMNLQSVNRGERLLDFNTW